MKIVKYKTLDEANKAGFVVGEEVMMDYLDNTKIYRILRISLYSPNEHSSFLTREFEKEVHGEQFVVIHCLNNGEEHMAPADRCRLVVPDMGNHSDEFDTIFNVKQSETKCTNIRDTEKSLEFVSLWQEQECIVNCTVVLNTIGNTLVCVHDGDIIRYLNDEHFEVHSYAKSYTTILPPVKLTVKLEQTEYKVDRNTFLQLYNILNK